MQDFEIDQVARKSVKGVFALVSRTFLIQILSVVTGLILTVFLDPGSFGVFFIVSSIIVFLNYFQDIGLAASLIQKKDEPTIIELRTTFTIQQALVFLIIVPSLIFSGKIAAFYRLDPSGLFLFFALLFSLFSSSLKTIPTVILERRLDFKKLVIPQVLENLVYNLVLVTLVITGFKITSFTIAILVRSVVGLVAIYFIQPWPFGFAFNKDVFKRLLSFGLPFQANSILALFKDDLLNIYIGKILPFSYVGYVGFSQKWAFMPLRLIMDNVIKITFPSMSRLQQDRLALRLAIERSLFLVSFIIFPSAFAMILLFPSLINFFPKYSKWEPAFLSLVFFSLNTIFSSISTPLANFLNAIGKVKITLYFMVFWTISTWVSTIYFVKNIGFNGVALSSFLVSLTSVLMVVAARRFIQFYILKPVVRQFVAAFFMGIFIYFTRPIVSNLFMLFVEVILAAIFYITILLLFSKNEIIGTTLFIIDSIRGKKKYE